MLRSGWLYPNGEVRSASFGLTSCQCCRDHMGVRRSARRNILVRNWAFSATIEKVSIPGFTQIFGGLPGIHAAEHSASWKYLETSELHSYVPEGSRIYRCLLGGCCPEIPRICVYHHVNFAATRGDSSRTLCDLIGRSRSQQAPCIRGSSRWTFCR